MRTKLTLRLDEELIDQAKRFAQTRGKSLSQIVEDHFRGLTRSDEGRDRTHLPEAPITHSLRGLLKGEVVEEADYRRHLEEKYR